MIDKNRLKEKAESYNIPLTPEKLEKLDKYREILVDYNQKVNLTSITDPLGIEDRHFIDCLLFAAHPLVKGKVADIGTGGGFPGIVVKVFNPDVDITLMDPTNKRCVFLKYALETLNLNGDVVIERAEEAARKIYREKYDVVTARAVADMRMLAEYCLPLVKVGGYFIAMKGDSRQETENAQNAVKKLGGEYVKTEFYQLPDSSKRSLVIFKKVSETPKQYPRNGGKIAKAPL